ncbi:sensor histidine kinase [Beggiatoa leptomitoformis]|uniref:histidine kinase n=1 Tax=Beggiatoa leptomitoformis TaxID=288004 RepID=A0A2N9YJ02_9GAMM|nr:ATP-binding protein [Beggiatoa leptomitoformis]ALG67174.1 sensor histidine kinase [Beggiatoa leptomitoformis]AUI70480.2 sensor histidine kinase [Beggiatoa leptomitoformis]
MLTNTLDVNTDILETESSPDWSALYLFNFYRLTLATLFVITFITDVAPSFLGRYNEALFLIAAWLYLGFSLACLFMTDYRYPSFNLQVLGQIPLDILLITLLMHTSGGVSSGMGMLLVVAVAGGSLLSEGRTAFFFAAIASLSVLGHVVYADTFNWFQTTSYTHASMLGITFFATAFSAYTLAKRVKISEALARQRGLHVQYLAQLNAEIVQHIQSGILVVDVVERIRLFNEATMRLLSLSEDPFGRTLAAVAPELAKQFNHWQIKRVNTSQVFRPLRGEAEIIATFTYLNRGESYSVLIVLDDATLTTRRAQQLKLAALGRLTASIAHEIRNPLGAISQAGQLLAESVHLNASDTRLVQIVVSQAQRVNTIIENILQLSRRETNTQQFALDVWVLEFIEEYRGQHGLTESKLALLIDKQPLFVYFDPTQLYQVVSNLCDNGLRYSQHDPLLTLHLGFTEDSKRPYLEIIDTGKGMPEEIATQIFEPFFTTEIKGTGLGLYLAREICEANQASLQVVSNSLTGCCFRILLTNHADNPHLIT